MIIPAVDHQRLSVAAQTPEPSGAMPSAVRKRPIARPAPADSSSARGVMRACGPLSRLTRSTAPTARIAPIAKSRVRGSPRSTPTMTGIAAPPIAVSGETMPIGPTASAA